MFITKKSFKVNKSFIFNNIKIINNESKKKDKNLYLIISFIKLKS